MKLRMEQESSKSQLASLEERLNVAEQRWDHSKAEPQTAAPKHTDGEVRKDPNPKRRRLEPTERTEGKVGSPHAGGEDSALHVASELMRRLSAEERMDALIAESHGKPGEKRIPKVPTSLVSRSRRKAPDSSPALLALPAPPTPSTPGRRPGESVHAAARVAKVALAEAEERHSRIKQLQQELVRRREALSSKAPVERPKIAVEGATEGEVALSELREQLKRKEDEKIEDAPDLHGHQAFLIPRSKSRAQKAFVEQEIPAVRAVRAVEVAQSPASVNSEVRRDAQAKDEGLVEEPWHVKERLAPPGRSLAPTRHQFTSEAVDDQAADEAAALPNKKAASMERLKAFDSRSARAPLQERSHPANLARPFRSAAPSRMLRSRKDSENCQQM